MRARLLVLTATLLLPQMAALAALRQPALAGEPADTHCVNKTGTGGCLTSIQAAINAATAGDTVLAHAGTYTEHLVMKEGITLLGEGWDSATGTVINGGAPVLPGSVISIPNGVSAATVISGVQLTNGHAEYGGCLYTGTGAPVIRNTWLYDCMAALGGGGVMVAGAFGSVVVANNLVQDNAATGAYGGGILVWPDASPVVNANAIFSNTAGIGGGIAFGTYGFSGAVVTATNNIIARNVSLSSGREGAGVVAWQRPLHLINNTVYHNKGDGVTLFDADHSLIMNNILVEDHDSGNTGCEIRDYVAPGVTTDDEYIYANDTWAICRYQGVAPYPMPGDYFIDPLIYASGDMEHYYHLRPDSLIATLGWVGNAPARDYDNETRTTGNGISIGADELDVGRTFLPLTMRQ